MHNRSMLLIIPVLAVLLVGTVSTSHAEFPSPLRQIQENWIFHEDFNDIFAEFPSPLKQIQEGTDPNDIRCNDGMVHAVRDDGRHACVRESTADRFNWQIIITLISADGHVATSQHCSPASCQHLYDEIVYHYHYRDAREKAELKPNRSANVIDTYFGEYPSPGNTWIELTYSNANPVPWEREFNRDPTETPPTERQLIELFYEKFDIKVLDVIKSRKYRNPLLVDTAISGTYHILVSDEDYEKFKKMSFGFVVFGSNGIIESRVAGHLEHFADWKAEKILISTSGDIELKLELDYDSEIPKRAAYYCHSCDEPTYVTKDLRFVDSVVFLTYSNVYYWPPVLGIVADSESPKRATVDYTGTFGFLDHAPRFYTYGDISLIWVRIFEDSEGERYYQWMRSSGATVIELDTPYTASGGFSVNYPYPEFAFDESRLGFDYVSWIQKNVYGDAS